MTARWHLLLIVPFVVVFALTAASQFVFIERSLYEQRSFGRVGTELTLINYANFLTDRFYLNILWNTVKVSALATFFTLLLTFPLAYVIARMRSRWASVLIAGVVVSTFVTIVIKVFGLRIIFSSNGAVNRMLISLGITDRPYTIIGTEEGVVIGLMHFTIGFGVLILYSVVQTIPRSLEFAAQVHGASRLRTFWRVILPISLPGLVAAALMIFNMCMGAFTSAALLGGGRVLTLPVLIQRTVMMETKFAFGGALAAILLVCVIAINLLSIFILTRMVSGRRKVLA
ncbi:MAG: ABC transporter permease [Rhodobacteraceae bacterium]|nr:ABC transporter permease [Paracoccaceae bacterium]